MKNIFLSLFVFSLIFSQFYTAESKPKWKPTAAQLEAAPFARQGKDILLYMDSENRIPRAEIHFERAFSIDPSSAIYFGDLYRVFEKDLPKTITWYHKASTHRIKNSESRLGGAMIRYGEFLKNSEPSVRTRNIYASAWIMAGTKLLDNDKSESQTVAKKLTAEEYFVALDIVDKINRNPMSILQIYD
jgi:hypothetical protein